jgi:hypothetical protein
LVNIRENAKFDERIALFARFFCVEESGSFLSPSIFMFYISLLRQLNITASQVFDDPKWKVQVVPYLKVISVLKDLMNLSLVDDFTRHTIYLRLGTAAQVQCMIGHIKKAIEKDITLY